MTPRLPSSSPSPRRKAAKRPTRHERKRRARRKVARNAARVALRRAAAWRYRCNLNFFWADCGALCRRTQRCCGHPETCFHENWRRLPSGDRHFRLDFMQAYGRLRDPDEAMIEAIALALMRAEGRAAASETPAQA